MKTEQKMESCRPSFDGDTFQYCSFSLIKFLLKAIVKWSLIYLFLCVVIKANAKEVMVFIPSFKKKKLPKFNLLAIWQDLIKLEF